MCIKNENQSVITIVFKIDQADYLRGETYFDNYKFRNHFAKMAFLEKLSRMEANDKKGRDARMLTDANYINELINKKLIKFN